MLPFMTPSKKLLAAVIVSAAVVQSSLAVLALRAFTDARDTVQYSCVVAQDTPSIAPGLPLENPESPGTTNEVSLQETLDRLGYTVNVPAVYGGHRLLRWNDYRLSTGDDALPATSFHGLKSSHFTKVSEQGMLEGYLDFGVADEQGHKRTLLKPDHNQNTYWIAAEGGESCSASLPDATQFYINDTTQTLQTGPLSSLPQANADHTPHLLVLPARTGGQWVDEGSNTGHWVGGTDTGGVLLCWEDWQDFDYQDLVILAENVVPNKTGAEVGDPRGMVTDP